LIATRETEKFTAARSGPTEEHKPLFPAVESSAAVGKIFRPAALLVKADASLINRFCLGTAIAFSSDANDKRGYP
jgi:hypothetical protein